MIKDSVKQFTSTGQVQSSRFKINRSFSTLAGKDHPKVFLKEYPLFTRRLRDLPALPKVLISTINQYSFCIAEKDPSFKAALLGSDVLLPDGIGIVGAVRFLTGQKIRKLTGADIHQQLLTELSLSGGSCFYLGSSEDTLSGIKEQLAKRYPNLKVGFYSPEYTSQFTDQENEEMIQAVNAFSPDVLFIGMTAPKQEKWAFTHKDRLNTGIICSIGAVFDFYGGTMLRPSEGWINMKLEWLGRLVNEPTRLWKRYLFYGPVFLASILAIKLRKSDSDQNRP